MNPVASAPSRQARSGTAWLRRCFIGAAFAIIAVSAAMYLAGLFFLWSIHQTIRMTTPLTIARYAIYYGHVPSVKRRLWICSGLGLGLVILAASSLLLPQRRSLHGDARFALRREIARAGLFSQDGIILGEVGSQYLILPGQQSVILAAPPRSGKGVGIVIPNLLHFAGSVVCVDIKRENWTVTAGFREKCGQACYLFDPLSEDGRTSRWNCLSYVSKDSERRINDIQRIADILYAEVPGTDPFWTASARSLFVGISLYLFETPSLPVTIGEVRRQGMATDDEGFGQHWRRIVEGRQRGRYPLSDECVRALYDLIDLAPVTASSVRKTFTSRLDLWANPLLDRATAADDFDLRELRKKPMSLYVAINPDDLHRLRPVLSLFFQQTIGLQTRTLPEHDPGMRHQVLMLLDEFTALGRIPIISESIAFVPGYDVRVLLVIQAPSQLREVYGPHASETMLKSVAARIVFAPKDFPDAKELSDELGNTTRKVKSHSRPNLASLNAGKSRSSSINISDHARPLLLPQEVKEIGQDNALVFLENARPIRCRKIRYFSDRRFRARLLPPPERPAVTDALVRSGERSGGARVSSLGSEAASPGKPSSPSEMSLEDIERIDSLTLDDFDSLKNLNFEHAGERPTDTELQADVERFLEAVL